MKLPERCQTCGACCAFGDEWVEVTKEEAGLIPAELVALPDPDADWEHLPRPAFVMRAKEGRCAALVGEVGRGVYCAIYACRPAVCRRFGRLSPACLWLLGWHGVGRPW
jgi:Fe-S-cluster containining protein